jgi:hypothetical protein
MSEQELASQEEDTNHLQDFEDDSSPEEMEEAKGLGWKSPKEWKGEPPKNGFKKAKDFLEHGKSVLPIVQSQNKKLERELAEARKELADTKAETAKKLENLERMSRTALKQQRERLEEKYAAAIDAAAEVGDKAAVQKLRSDEKKALKEFDEEAAEKEAPKKDDDKPKGEIPKEVESWVKDNPWFEDDEEAKAVAITRHGKLLRDHPTWSLERNLEEVRKYVQKRFPEHFEEESKGDDDEDEAPKRKGSRVEGGGSRMGGDTGRSSWSKLPADAQRQADTFIKEDGLFLEKGETVEKDLQKARERYAKQYLEQK